MSELKLLKAIWEIRYPPAASLFDNRGRIARRWYLRDGFEHWSIGRNHVKLYSKDESLSFFADYRRMVFDAEGWNLSEFCISAAKVTSWVTRLLRIRSFERIGFRVYQITECNSFETIQKKMTRRLFALDETDWEVFGGEPLDIAFPLTLTFGDHKANFKMGPMRNDQYENLLQSLNIKENLPKASFFIDFDLYQEKPTFKSRDIKKEYFAHLQDSGKLMQQVSNNILAHFGGFK
ncbi:hypothetical protein MNBD_CHLOROFLEXI01-2908 [hydrothermal vent metagenome]|uniref:Uncharacterized protein n=1 Tax=hydrothermal vent metagenome TaxID=652676 RepID=A0A3B0WC47_9ZZZZ